jgi:hypothetical protein
MSRKSNCNSSSAAITSRGSLAKKLPSYKVSENETQLYQSGVIYQLNHCTVIEGYMVLVTIHWSILTEITLSFPTVIGAAPRWKYDPTPKFFFCPFALLLNWASILISNSANSMHLNLLRHDTRPTSIFPVPLFPPTTLTPNTLREHVP